MATSIFEETRLEIAAEGGYMRPFFDIVFKMDIEEEDIQSRLETGEGTLPDDYQYKIYSEEDKPGLFDHVEFVIYSEDDWEE